MTRTLRMLGGLIVLALPLLACNLSGQPEQVQATATAIELTLLPTGSGTPTITPLVLPSVTVTPISSVTPFRTATPFPTLAPTQQASDAVVDWPGRSCAMARAWLSRWASRCGRALSAGA